MTVTAERCLLSLLCFPTPIVGPIFTTYPSGTFETLNNRLVFNWLEFQMCPTDMCEHIYRANRTMPFVILVHSVFVMLDIGKTL